MKEESLGEHMSRVFPFTRELLSEKGQLLNDLKALQDDIKYSRKLYKNHKSLACRLLLAYIGDKEVTEAFNKINKNT